MGTANASEAGHGALFSGGNRAQARSAVRFSAGLRQRRLFSGSAADGTLRGEVQKYMVTSRAVLQCFRTNTVEPWIQRGVALFLWFLPPKTLFSAGRPSSTM